MAVRKVVTRSGHGVRGYFPSRKMMRMVAWESQLERDAIMLLEFSLEVVGFREQPVRVYFDQDGERHQYIPDFEVDLADGRILHVEVKPESKLRKPDIARRFAATIRKRFFHPHREGYPQGAKTEQFEAVGIPPA